MEVINNTIQETEHCCYCRIELNYTDRLKYKQKGKHIITKTIDHLVPISKGGNNSELNKLVCCSNCNNEKTNRTINQYISFLEKERIRYYSKGPIADAVVSLIDIKLNNAKVISEYVDKQGIKLYKNKEVYLIWNPNKIKTKLMYDKNEISKELLKSKAIAKFEYYENGNLYYRITLNNNLYQFPVSVTRSQKITLQIGEKDILTYVGINFAEDLNGTKFSSEIKGSLLNRWIKKAIDNSEFIKLNQ